MEAKKPLGLYLHIPFCVQKCRYCDFLSGKGSREEMEEYVEALVREIRAYKEYLFLEKKEDVIKKQNAVRIEHECEMRFGEEVIQNEENVLHGIKQKLESKEQEKQNRETNVWKSKQVAERTEADKKQLKENDIEQLEVQTIYFGGGTPSILQADAILRCLDAIRETFTVSETAEITLEMNPGTVTREKLKAYKQAGVNRLSIGLQSVREDELKLLGRIHTFAQFQDCFTMAREEGFRNISVDLISGLPRQTKEAFLESLDIVKNLGAEHISVYSLIIEEGTPFYEWYGEEGSRQEELISEETDREFYELTKQELAKAGYIRYEFSNYAREGFESRHNSSYWTGVDYLGLGLGASSYFLGERFHNTADKSEYVKNAANPEKLRQEVQKLSIEERMEEFMFLGLRLCKGISKLEFERRFNCSIEEVYGNVLKRLIGLNVLFEEGDRIALTDFGIDVSNQVLAEFLLSDTFELG